ncbi:MAG: cysteine desulfurase family protein [Allosphingosinicella sp.]
MCGSAPSQGVCIYLDGFATTAIAPQARDAMLEALALPANPSSPHALGERAANLIGRARRDIAALVGCSPAELVFTSGATEANNLAITGGAYTAPAGRRRIVVSAIEHRAVLEPARALAEMGFDLVLAPVDTRGVIDLAKLGDIVRDDCWLVSAMAVNNETGVVQPIAEIARIAHERGALIHTDAAQAIGKIPVDLAEWDVDYASITAHKMHGPVGIGALYIAAGATPPRPLQLGGGQQAGRRAGTEPVALIAGFGAAAAVACEKGSENATVRAALLNRILEVLSEHQVRWEKISGEAETVPGGCAIVLPGVDADEVCQRIQNEIFISTSSACSAGRITLSHVLTSMGIDPDRGRSTIRLMMSEYGSIAEAETAGEALARAIRESRSGAGRIIQ